MKKRLLSILLCCAMAVSMYDRGGNVDSRRTCKIAGSSIRVAETTTAATEESSEG